MVPLLLVLAVFDLALAYYFKREGKTSYANAFLLLALIFIGLGLAVSFQSFNAAVPSSTP